MPILLFAGPTGSLEDTTTTIEIARSSKPTLIEDGKVYEDRRIPFHIRIGGIAQDRIVALTYDYQTKKLTDINISLDGEKEVPTGYMLGVYNQSELFYELKPSLRVPPPRNYYDTAAIITPGMEAEIWRRHPLVNHTRALICRVYDNMIDFGKENETVMREESRLKKSAKKLGFYARHEDGMVVIGFQKPEGEQRDMAAWELRLPAQLQAA